MYNLQTAISFYKYPASDEQMRAGENEAVHAGYVD
jgi:hypothetical protein